MSSTGASGSSSGGGGTGCSDSSSGAGGSDGSMSCGGRATHSHRFIRRPRLQEQRAEPAVRPGVAARCGPAHHQSLGAALLGTAAASLHGSKRALPPLRRGPPTHARAQSESHAATAHMYEGEANPPGGGAGGGGLSHLHLVVRRLALPALAALELVCGGLRGSGRGAAGSTACVAALAARAWAHAACASSMRGRGRPARDAANGTPPPRGRATARSPWHSCVDRQQRPV